MSFHGCPPAYAGAFENYDTGKIGNVRLRAQGGTPTTLAVPGPPSNDMASTSPTISSARLCSFSPACLSCLGAANRNDRRTTPLPNKNENPKHFVGRTTSRWSEDTLEPKVPPCCEQRSEDTKRVHSLRFESYFRCNTILKTGFSTHARAGPPS